jgi:hypothetical protein
MPKTMSFDEMLKKIDEMPEEEVSARVRAGRAAKEAFGHLLCAMVAVGVPHEKLIAELLVEGMRGAAIAGFDRSDIHRMVDMYFDETEEKAKKEAV